ncbi:hypothetical protein Pr1d_46250 [Bythopirellula goksoeyrii]|uniref:Uncharacterized protein n=1 Tax=Bythopirellula goksoeyrii TaxID=1400387 RepID=A0A5B9QEA8_9BACT|nr:hypothetical protein Pr1d_46250 [Bythopirellula goksoeyrii]
MGRGFTLILLIRADCYDDNILIREYPLNPRSSAADFLLIHRFLKSRSF